MKLKNIIILLVVAIFCLNVGFWISWFFTPCPKKDTIYNHGGLAVGIHKGIFNKTDKDRWMYWEDFKKYHNERLKKKK